MTTKTGGFKPEGAVRQGLRSWYQKSRQKQIEKALTRVRTALTVLVPQEPGEECARIFSGETFNRDRYRYRNRFRGALSIEPFDFELDPDSDSESCQNHFSHIAPMNPESFFLTENGR